MPLPTPQPPACPGCRQPQRPPCHRTDWPAAPTLTFCNQQAAADERAVPLRCNVETIGTTPAYAAEGSCADWHAGNCYAACPSGSAHDLTTDAAGYALGSTIIVLGSGLGTLYPGDTVRFDGDDTLYTIAATALPIPLEDDTDLTGYFIILQAPGLLLAIPAVATPFTVIPRGTRDFSACEKTGWKAVRAMKMWHGRAGWLENCPPACDESLARYRTANRVATYTQIGYGVAQVDYDAARANYATCMASATNEEDAKVCMDDFIAAMVEASTSGPTSYYDYSWERQYTVSTTGAVTQDTCTDNDGGEGWLTSTSAPASLVMFGNWACGPDFSETHSYGPSFNEWFAGGVPDLEWSVQIVQQTNTIIEIEVIGASYESGNFYINTWHGTWVLSEPYALEDCVGDAYSLAGEWDLSDDVQYPWRPPGSWLVTDGGGTHAARIPFVKRREVGPNSPDIGGAACDADLSCSLSTLTPCPYDGEAIGIPLPNGYGPHYAFWDGSGQIAALGWNPGLGLPDTATWWTNSSEELDEDVFPSGGWVFVSSGIVYVQKWVQTRTPTASANYFRPCGADSRTDPNYRPICGRCAVASVSESAGTVTLTLTDPAPYLLAGDSLTLLTYAADFTEQPLATLNLTTITSSTEVAGTWDVSPTDALPGTGLYAKSTGAPHYSWDDDASKGDALFCVATTNLCTSAVTNECVPACTQFSPCEPEVLAVLCPDSPETFQAAAEYRFADTGLANNSGLRVIVTPRSEEDDPLWTGDPAETPQIESRCAPPGAAPAGTTYAGCGTIVCLEGDGDTTSEPTFNRPTDNGQDPPVALSGIGTAVPYDAISFTVDADGDYNLLVTTGGTWEVFICLYAGSFNPASPLDNCLIADIDYPESSPVFGQAGIDYALTTGTTYTAVITGFENASVGTYHLSVCGDGSVSSA